MSYTIHQVLDFNRPGSRDTFVRLSAQMYKDALDEGNWPVAREAGIKLFGLRPDDVEKAIEARKAL